MVYIRESEKKIWINPVVFDLHIANQTLTHEAVHAAQVCAGNGAWGIEVKLPCLPCPPCLPYTPTPPHPHTPNSLPFELLIFSITKH
jgi:hypothetical protein